MCERASTLEAVAERLLAARSVVVCAHVNPDGDAVGATLALVLALRSAGVAAVPTLADDHAAPVTYAFLDGANLYRQAAELPAPQVFLALDTPNWSRLGVAQDLARAASTLVVIDHHADNACFGDLNVVDAAAASTASLVWRLMPLLGVPPTPAIARAAFTGLMTDTGRFSYGNTSAGTLRDAADMIDAGADAFGVYAAVYESRTPAALQLIGRVLARITTANGGHVAYSWMNDADLGETGALMEDTENVVDLVRQVTGPDAVAFFKSEGDSVRVSLRAKTPGVDVGSAARTLGGGGHFAAAGVTVSGDLPTAIAEVLRVLPGGAS